METQLRNCTTCNYHYGKQSIDDVADECFPCVHAEKTLGFYPNWAPVPTPMNEVKERENSLGELLRQKLQGKVDNVNSPKHYTTGGIETIDYIKAKLGHEGTINYCMGNVMKYTSRWQEKNGKEDLKKAQWYLNYAINMMEQPSAY
jgi:hypothetical protein